MIDNLISFLNSSPVNFLAISTIANQLMENGYEKIDAEEPMPNLLPGMKVFFTKNDSSLYAFEIGQEPLAETGAHIVAAHCDSPAFKIKPKSEIFSEGGLVKLNTELYGGAIMSTWMDRPLSLAGRVILKGSDSMHPETRLLHIKRPLLQIPNLAIHFNREVNNGVKLSKQKDMLPILGIITDELEKDNLLIKLIANELSVPAESILDFDVFLYDTTPACRFGLHDEFISSGRLDDLSMVHAGLNALTMSQGSVSTKILAIFDNEEVGSGTKQGAGSPFLASLIRRIIMAQGGTIDDFYRMIEKSFLISADNAHAWHPNYNEKYDPTNHPLMGHGPVVKYNSAQKYLSDAYSASVFFNVCEEAGVPCQTFVNNSDFAGGSTLGNILSGSLPLKGVDMGNPIWAMHSIREIADARDHEYCIKAFKKFFEI